MPATKEHEADSELPAKSRQSVKASGRRNEVTEALRKGTVRPNGPELVRRRHGKGWTQDDLERKVGCGLRTLQRAEKGEPILVRTLGEIARALGCEPADLLVSQGPPPPSVPFIPGNAPPRPPLIIGRDNDLNKLKSMLFRPSDDKQVSAQVIAVMWGLPGVGKSTLSAYLANDPEIGEVFTDGGPLWASLGQKPDLFSHLDSWGRALGVTDLREEKTLEKVSERVAALLRHRHMLLIIEDVWLVSHARTLMVGGHNCATLITTRDKKAASALVPRADDLYTLGVLSDEDALKLLQKLAPKVVDEYPSQSAQLVSDLEGLPLALQVAGRLLRAKDAHGYNIEKLLRDLRSGAELLEQEAPPDMADLVSQTTPKVAALLRKSTDVLDNTTRERFALLGVVKEKPATFSRDFMKAQWLVDDPLPTAEILVDRGLIEPVENQRYRMHALLVALAYSLLEK